MLPKITSSLEAPDAPPLQTAQGRKEREPLIRSPEGSPPRGPAQELRPLLPFLISIANRLDQASSSIYYISSSAPPPVSRRTLRDGIAYDFFRSRRPENISPVLDAAMRASVLGGLAVAASVGAIWPRSSEPFYAERTGLFRLVVASSNSSLDGRSLRCCREWLLIHSLCLGEMPPWAGARRGQIDEDDGVDAIAHQFALNYTTKENTYLSRFPGGLGDVGILTWKLPPSVVAASSGLKIKGTVTGNVIVPLFTLDETQDPELVGFDREERLHLWRNDDDGVYPPVRITAVPKAVYSWYLCTTDVGRLLHTLSWVVGDKPENPSCQKIDVKREFV
ncbi:hypothetical protein JHW43_006754 [Diplocarpon mali]|nr:hypothetical protein JHW43_006754 [Diplocarpon mali]